MSVLSSRRDASLVLADGGQVHDRDLEGYGDGHEQRGVFVG